MPHELCKVTQSISDLNNMASYRGCAENTNQDKSINLTETILVTNPDKHMHITEMTLITNQHKDMDA